MEPIEKTVEKIRKCLRLAARSAEDGERAAARNRAEALAAAAGLDIAGLSEDMPCPVEEADAETHCRTGIEQPLALSLIREHFGVASYFYVRRDGRTQRVAWIGERANIPVARQIYVVATRAARRAWEDRKKLARQNELEASELRRRYRALGMKAPHFAPDVTKLPHVRKNFMQGFFAALDKTLRAHPLRADRDALVRERSAAERFLTGQTEKGDFGSYVSRNGKTSIEAQVAGYDAGRRVALSRPVAGAAAPLRLATC